MPEAGPGSSPLLGPDDPAPFALEGARRRGPLVIIGDHAGRAVPRGLKLGVPSTEMDRHIAWDIGVAGLGRRLAAALDAPFAHQPYSRLVIDCNRHPARADAVPEISDGTPIPANQGLAAGDREARRTAIHEPYHHAIGALLDTRGTAETGLLLLHSFTPAMAGRARPWTFGVLHTGQRFALALLARLRAADIGPIGDNEPYRMDEVDYTAARHGTGRGLDFAEIEVRQDLIGEEVGEERVATLLAPLITGAWAAR